MRKIFEKLGLSSVKHKGTREKRRRNFNKPLFLVSAAVFLWVALALATGFCAPAEHVVIVSLDGGRPDVILTSNTPNIHEMAEQGAYTWWAQTINPSITLPSHSSMLTGCLPQKHGVTWNDWKPELGFVKTTTCFEIAKQAGMTTAMFVSKQKLEHIAKPGTVDKFVTISGDDAVAAAKAAGEYFQKKKPNLLFVHFSDPDATGHAHHWGSKEYRTAIENCDRGIGILRAIVKDAGVSATTVWIITADHGGHLNSHGSTDVRDMTIPWICYDPGIVQPGEIEEPVSTCDTAVMAVCALGLKPDSQWDGKILSGIFISNKSH